MDPIEVTQESEVGEDHITFVCEPSVENAVQEYEKHYGVPAPLPVWRKLQKSGRSSVYIKKPKGERK